MATKNQITANRQNAQKSTGPRTEEGKAAIRHNAMTHGLLASDFVLPGESHIEFDILREELTSCFAMPPEGRLEDEALDQLTLRIWRLRRCARTEAAVYRNLLREQEIVRSPDKWGAAFAHGAGTFSSISRYEAHLDRSALKFAAELRRLQSNRKKRDGAA